MNLRERFLASCLGEPVDRVVNTEFGYWDETIERWCGEGLPEDVGFDPEALAPEDRFAQHFSIDLHWLAHRIPVQLYEPAPLFEQEILEEDEYSQTMVNKRGILLKITKRMASIPHHIKFPVASRHDFEAITWRYRPDSAGRYPADWDERVREYRRRDYPLGLQMHGFYGQLREWMGLENLSLAFYDQPELVHTMVKFWEDFLIETCGRALADVEADFVRLWEDMSFKGGPLVSAAVFREFFTPSYKRLVAHFKAHGIPVIHVDSDGEVGLLVELLTEAGVNALHPFERAAGNDLMVLRERHPQLIMFGGVDKRALAQGKKAIEREMTEVIRPLVARGKFVPHVDHAVPPDVSLEDFRYYLDVKSGVLENV